MPAPFEKFDFPPKLPRHQDINYSNIAASQKFTFIVFRYAMLPAAVQWGVEREAAAKQAYLSVKNRSGQHGEVAIEETGLTLSTSQPYLGASSDGRVTDSSNGIGVLEVKCPFSIQGQNITNLSIPEIFQMHGKDFCLDLNQLGKFTLKKTHKYYAQVQGEMAIMNLPWCDFVVWTAAKKNNLCIDRVMFDPEFVEGMMAKLSEFYVKCVLPKIVKQC